MVATIKELYCRLERCIATRDICAGREVQRLIAEGGLQSNPFLGSHLIRMFSLCGTLREAVEVFNLLSPLTVFAWNALILAHVDHGVHHRACELFFLMQQCGFSPNSHIYVATLKACTAMRHPNQGMLVHEQVAMDELDADAFVANALIDMYAKCGQLENAHKIFTISKERSVASWTAIISGYSLHGCPEESLSLFNDMKEQGILPNDVTFLGTLKACTSEAFLIEGKKIHVLARSSSLVMDEMLGNAMICMYARCGSLYHACRVFNELPKQNIVTWNAMISGYGLHGCGQEAFQLLEGMQKYGINPNKITFASVLKAMSRAVALAEGQLTHSKILIFGSEWDAYMDSTLIDMYTDCGCLKDALNVFYNLPKRELVTWSAMISGLVHYKLYEEAFVHYNHMQQEGIESNSVVFVCILKACSSLGLLDTGRLIHSFITMSKLESILVVGNILIDMYTKAESIDDAFIVFEEMQERDIISWNSMIFGCAEHGFDEEALHLFSELQKKGQQPTSVTYMSALRACSDATLLEWGRLVNCSIIQAGCESELILGSALIDMYAKCENIDDAVIVFKGLPNQNDLTWSAIVIGCAQCSNIDLALSCFATMLQEGYKLNDVLFVSLLSACSQAGMVDDAFYYFNSMETKYGITPVLEHYCCVIDLLGRMGCINQAEDLLKTLPLGINHTVWSSLLSHCQTYCNVELGNKCFDNFVFLDHRHASSYVLMSKLLKEVNMWKDAATVQALKASSLAWRKAGNAVIKIDSTVFEFCVTDKISELEDELQSVERRLLARLRLKSYMPQIDAATKLVSNVEEALVVEESESRHYDSR